MEIKKYIQFTGLLCILTIHINCSEDFLEQPPGDAINADNYWQTETDVRYAVNAIYNAHARLMGFNVGWLAFGDVAADDLADSDESWFQDIDTYTLGATGNVAISGTNTQASTFNVFYMAVYRANWVLENIDKVTDINPEKKRQYRNEAIFLRGLAYLYLTFIWGDIPYYTMNLSPDEAKTISRTPQEDVYEGIEADFLTAAGLNPDLTANEEGGLPSKGNAENLRATKEAAMSFLARLYLYMEEYDKCEKVAKIVIDSKKYSLDPDYGNNWDNITGRYNDETLFGIEFRANGPFSYWMANTGAMIHMFTADGNFSTDNSSFIIMWPADHFVDVHESGDNRLKMNVFQSGDQFELGYEGKQTYIPHNEPGSDNGYLLAKYIRRNHMREIDQGQKYDDDLVVKVMRYSEILLIYSEACYQNGKMDEAFEYLNKVRRRAFGLDPEGSDTSKDRITGEDIYMEALEYERRIELFAECHRFFDLRRWGLLEERLGPLGYNPVTQGLFPIPQEERDKNPNLNQNPGY